MSRKVKYILFIGLISSAAYAKSEEISSIASSSSKEQSVATEVTQCGNEAMPSPEIEVATPAPIAATANIQGFTLPARTPVKFTLGRLVSSKTAVAGEQFQLHVAEDISINGVLLIPNGTLAIGEVIHASKAGGLGKAGELLVTIRYIDLSGQKIKMRSFQPLQGKGQSHSIAAISAATAMSTVPYVGLLAGFIQGGNIEIPAQTLVQALTAKEAVINPIIESTPIIIDSTESNTITTNNETGESR